MYGPLHLLLLSFFLYSRKERKTLFTTILLRCPATLTLTYLLRHTEINPPVPSFRTQLLVGEV